MGDFQSVDKVQACISTMRAAEEERAKERAWINILFNGKRPYTPEEEKKHNIEINVNFQEGTNKLLEANRQVQNALLPPGDYFTIDIENAPASRAVEYSRIVTEEANRVHKRGQSGQRFMHGQRGKFASMVLHGIGPALRENEWQIFPRNVAIGDLLIPTDTDLTFENLEHFAPKRRLTPGELYRMTSDEKHRDPGWKMKTVRQVLKWFKDNPGMGLSQSERSNPEAFQEVMKQNGGWANSDAVPVCECWYFYYRKDDDPDGEWYRKIVLDKQYGQSEPDKDFLYESKEPCAKSLNRLLNVQFGDGSIVAPFKYHSVRGLGQMLYGVMELMNRLRCKFYQHTFEQLLTLIRVTSPLGEGRPKNLLIDNYGVVKQGVSFIKQEERHQIDGNLVQAAFDQFRQLMSENALSLTSKVNDGTKREQTATEVMAQLNSVSAMVGSMLNLAYTTEGFSYSENCRRLALPKSPSATARDFQRRCKDRGVPEKCMNPDYWVVEPERAMGSGHRQLELAILEKLMGARAAYPAEAQEDILRDFTISLTGSARKGNAWVPRLSKDTSATVEWVESKFATLYKVGKIHKKRGLNEIEYIESLLGMMIAIVKQIQKTDNMGTMADVIGLNFVAKDVQVHILKLEQDKSQKTRTDKYMDTLGQLMNEVKGFQQRLMQKNAANGDNGEAQAEVQKDLMVTAKKLEHKDAAFKQKTQQNTVKFQQSQAVKTAEAQAAIARGNAEASAEITRKTLLAATEAARKPPGKPE